MLLVYRAHICRNEKVGICRYRIHYGKADGFKLGPRVYLRCEADYVRVRNTVVTTW